MLDHYSEMQLGIRGRCIPHHPGWSASTKIRRAPGEGTPSSGRASNCDVYFATRSAVSFCSRGMCQTEIFSHCSAWNLTLFSSYSHRSRFLTASPLLSFQPFDSQVLAYFVHHPPHRLSPLQRPVWHILWASRIPSRRVFSRTN